MKRYIISDLHLGHQAILKYRTQFATLDDMHDTIINNWNSVVTPQDKVYILGDVAWNKQALALLNSMNGKKVLIKGNHDILPLKEYVKYFEDIRGAMEYKGCILTHVPVHESQLERFKINIHGHMHDRNITRFILHKNLHVGYDANHEDIYENIEIQSQDTRYINVCCEQVNYTPVLLEEIIEK
jgi:calcineurin-like phosphoesterase family protein